MKTFLILLITALSGGPAFSQASVYALSVPGTKGQALELSAYQGQKLIVAICRADGADQQRLAGLDSLQKALDGKIPVILIPLSDLTEDAATSRQRVSIDSVPASLTRSGAVKGRRASGEQQHPLLRWLTHTELNTHFNSEIDTEDQLYVISESGELYADLKGDIDLGSDFMQRVLQRVDPGGDRAQQPEGERP